MRGVIQISGNVRYTPEDAREFAVRAAMAAGAGEAAARSLANATVAAELCGRPAVGFAHFLDYLDGFAAGRIAGGADHEIDFPTPAAIRVDAKGGIAQLGFDRAFDVLLARASLYGLALFTQQNSYTAGELGYYARRLAEAGLVALIAGNGPAQMTAGAGRKPVYGTNPMAFAAPVENAPPLVIDQASSATAFVNVRRAADMAEAIPAAWAIDADGKPTTDAREAIKGALLAFGGARGANIALMVEILAAGLTGANWSLDAPSFAEGTTSPGAGLLVIALSPTLLAPDFSARLASQVERLAGSGIHIPGRTPISDEIVLPRALVDAIEDYGKA